MICYVKTKRYHRDCYLAILKKQAREAYIKEEDRDNNFQWHCDHCDKLNERDYNVRDNLRRYKKEICDHCDRNLF